jgi:hypothetical protein
VVVVGWGHCGVVRLLIKTVVKKQQLASQKVQIVLSKVLPLFSHLKKLGVRLDHQGPRSPHLKNFAGQFFTLYTKVGLRPVR